MRWDIVDLYNDATSFSIYSLGLDGNEREQVDDELQESTASGLIMRVGLMGDDMFTVRLVIDEPLSEQESAEWVGSLDWMLKLPDGKLVIEGGFTEDDLEPEDIQDLVAGEDMRVVAVPNGDYRVTLYTYVTSVNGMECLSQAGNDEAIGTYFRRTRPGVEFPDWLKYQLTSHLDGPNDDPGHEDEWREFMETRFGDLDERMSGEDYPFIDFVIHLTSLGEDSERPKLTDDMIYDYGLFKEAVNPRKPETCPLGLTINLETIFKQRALEFDQAPQSPELGDATTPQLISLLSKNPYSSDFREAQQELERRGEAVIEALIKALESGKSIKLRMGVATVLGAIGGDRALEALMNEVDDPRIRQSVLKAVSKIGGDRAYEFLVNAIFYENTAMSSPELEIFGKYNHPQVLPFAVEMLGSHVMADVMQARVILSARFSEDPTSTAQALIEAAQSSNNQQLQQNVMMLLRNLDPGQAYGIYEEFSDDEDDKTRINAIIGKGTIDTEDELNDVLNAVSGDDNEIRVEALKLLKGRQEDAAIQALIQALDDENPSVLFFACDALADVGDERAVQPLIKLLDYFVSSVRDTAAGVLEKIGTEEAIAAVETYRKSRR